MCFISSVFCTDSFFACIDQPVAVAIVFVCVCFDSFAIVSEISGNSLRFVEPQGLGVMGSNFRRL